MLDAAGSRSSWKGWFSIHHPPSALLALSLQPRLPCVALLPVLQMGMECACIFSFSSAVWLPLGSRRCKSDPLRSTTSATTLEYSDTLDSPGTCWGWPRAGRWSLNQGIYSNEYLRGSRCANSRFRFYIYSIFYIVYVFCIYAMAVWMSASIMSWACIISSSNLSVCLASADAWNCLSSPCLISRLCVYLWGIAFSPSCFPRITSLCDGSGCCDDKLCSEI